MSYGVTRVKSRTMIQVNLLAEQKQTQRHGTQTCGYQVGKVLGRINWEFGNNRYTLLYIK